MFSKDQLYKLGIMAYLTVWYVGSFWLIAAISSGLFEHALGIDFISLQDYFYYALAGAIGGTLYAMRLFHLYYDSLTERWVLWYILRPILCAGTAVMTIILFESGIMLLEAKESVIAKIGIAFLVGFGYGKVMDKLKTLTETLFNGKDNSTDGDDKSKS
ncbi:hypothetical protein [Paenibacillus radicis (ex Xue et al. 2023)]|uniref:Uncharacterized protein n=1 Tax=Paenibacillus radicis (ex Xue et al. 2023) TaxID=2972489 RepID=A0ABT1YVB4_9BACL|nr:hypothetical protein [Paenibacillus radicis (ex Xue et al. 2023)]MCR8636890.1 hypothetical protein [Paenibacillus radicis (ex Xue et al. 2023)]